MKNIQFKRIKIRNFLSFGNDPIEFVFESGINFITGFNEDKKSDNGVGKTALIVESLSFVLFGECYREINQKTIRHDRNNEPCIVELSLQINDSQIEIVRSLNPNKLFLSVDGVDKTRTIPETNKDIVELLSISKDIFMNTIVMTNRDSAAFLSQKTAPKTKFIEGILGLEIFSKMHDTAKANYNTANKDVIRGDATLTEIRNSLENDKRYEKIENDKVNSNIADAVELLEDLRAIQPENYSKEMAQCNTELQEVTVQYEDINNKLKKAEIKKAGIDTDVRNKNAELKKYTSKPTNCPTCKRPLEDCNNDALEADRAVLVADIETLTEQQNKFVGAIARAKERAAEHKRTMSQLTDKISEYGKLNERYAKSQERIVSIENQLASFRQFENPFSGKIIEGQKKLEEAKQKNELLQKNLHILEGIKFITSTSGVKTLVLKKIIKTLNDRLSFYLKRLDAPCTCVFDEFFEEKMYNEFGKEISYGNNSGGEMKRVDFAMLFTFRDIRRLQSGVTINISVFDELFDGAMDGVAMDAILDLLKEITEKTGEAFYIISHRKEQLDVQGCKLIELVKRRGVTTLI